MGQALNVEAVEDDPSLWRGLVDGLDVRTEHVDGHRLEQGAALGAQGIEERFERRRATPLGRPDDLTALVVYDDGDVLLVPPVAEFVDTDQP